MWKCPACETLNNGDICVICGEPKPTGGDVKAPVEAVHIAPPVTKERDVPVYSPETSVTSDGLDPTPKLEYKPAEPSGGNSNLGMIIMLVILGVIALIIVISASVSYANDEGPDTAYYGELQEQSTDTYNLLTE